MNYSENQHLPISSYNMCKRKETPSRRKIVSKSFPFSDKHRQIVNRESLQSFHFSKDTSQRKINRWLTVMTFHQELFSFTRFINSFARWTSQGFRVLVKIHIIFTYMKVFYYSQNSLSELDVFFIAHLSDSELFVL